MEIISHRGFLDYGENSVMGIISALDKIQRVEFDIFFKDGVWLLAHDLKSIHVHTETFSKLMETLKQSPLRKGMFIIDIKWELCYNQKFHSFSKALAELKKQIPLVLIPFFDWNFQVSYPYLTPYLMESGLKGKKGLILEEVNHNFDKRLDYFMVDIRFFCKHSLNQLKGMFPHKLLIGYTIPSLQQVKYYQSYYPVLSFLIVDLRLSDFKISSLKKIK